MDIREKKIGLRKQLLKQAGELDSEYIAASDAAIEKALLQSNEWEQADRVFAYVSRGAEPYTHGIIRQGLREGKKVAVPLCKPKGIMEARYIESLDTLKPNKWGILEPDESYPLADPAELGLVVVPCVATDRRQYRIGYGGGFYDRYLLRVNCPSICLCRARMIVPELPVEPFDLRMEMVISD